ncbi:hypothetical protein D3C73_1554030 [compost metagenome]
MRVAEDHKRGGRVSQFLLQVLIINLVLMILIDQLAHKRGSPVVHDGVEKDIVDRS